METVFLKKRGKEVYEYLMQVLRKRGFLIKESDLNKGYITANNKASWLSYGERIEITLKEKSGGTDISIKSYSPGVQIVDWGTNDKNEKLIQKELLNFQ